MKRYIVIAAILLLTSCATGRPTAPVDITEPQPVSRPMTPSEVNAFWDSVSVISIIWFTIL